jgi:SH3-like domain-containing protein
MIGLLSLAALVTFTGLVTIIRDEILATRWLATSTPTALALPSITATASLRTSTPSRTLAPSTTPLPTNTFEPTPSYAIITSPELGGANVRTKPGIGTLIITLQNGSLVQVLPEIEPFGSATWVRVRLADNTEGWVLQTVLTAATLTPTPTLTLTLTPTL